MGVERRVSNNDRRPSSALWSTVGILVALTLLLTACPEGSDDEVSRDFEVYRLVIADMVAKFPVDPAEPDEKPVIYLESFAPAGVSLVDQVDLVAAFGDDYELRFVDQRVEALDDELEGLPVRVGGALFGLGPIVDDDPPTVRVERYVDERDVTAFRYRVRGDDDWRIDGTPEPVPAEGFVASS